MAQFTLAKPLQPKYNYTTPYLTIFESTRLVSVLHTRAYGGIGIDNLTLTVLNLIPSANAGLDIFVDEGQEFSFNGSINNPGNENITFFWDFDITSDGRDVDNITDNDVDSILLNASHIFMNNETYTAKLIVRDDDNSTAWDFVNITEIGRAHV